MFPRYICWVWVHSRRSKSLIWEGTFSESVFEIIKKWRRRGRALNNSSGNLHSTLHCIALTRPKRFRKEINYILIHHNTLQSFVWSSIASMFPFWKLNVFICGFSTKVTCAFLFSETMEKWRFQRYIRHAKNGGPAGKFLSIRIPISDLRNSVVGMKLLRFSIPICSDRTLSGDR